MFSYYSTHGHVEKLAKEIEKGAASVEGVEAKLWQVCNPFSFCIKNLHHVLREQKTNVSMLSC